MPANHSHSSEIRRRYILCVDDEHAVLEALYTQLHERFSGTYDIECAESGREALALFDQIYRAQGKVELVICDQLMPDVLGQYVLEAMHQRDNRVMKILLTGQAGLEAVTYAINHAGLHKYIEKPWDKYDLLLTVENLLQQHAMTMELDLSRQRFEMILRSMNNGVISLDFRGRITSFNHAAATILDIDARRVVGKMYSEVFFSAYDNEAMNDVVIQAITEYTPQSYQEISFVRHDGATIPLGLMTSLLKDDKGSDIGILIVFHDLSEIQKYTTLKSMFSRYVAKQVVDKITASDEITLHGEKRDVTLLFSDIRGFTTLTEQLEPTEVVATLNAYFSAMIDVIYSYEGTLDKFMGDGIMCIFGAPIDQPDHARRAAKTALSMKQALASFNEQQERDGKPLLKVGIGINTGNAVVGNVGSERRMEYTAIGDNVNLAARLQAIATGGQIIISQSTFQALSPFAKVTTLPPTKIKGKIEPIPIYDLIDLLNLPDVM